MCLLRQSLFFMIYECTLACARPHFFTLIAYLLGVSLVLEGLGYFHKGLLSMAQSVTLLSTYHSESPKL